MVDHSIRRRYHVADGWLIDRELRAASDAAQIPALRELGELVRRGVIPPTTPCVIGRRRTDAPWQDVVVAVPLPAQVALDWVRGNRTAAADVAAMLEQGYAVHMAKAQRGEEV